MKYILGIDQGGTKTAAVIADENGNILGLGIDIGACHASDGMDYAMEKIYNACQQAFKKANIKIFIYSFRSLPYSYGIVLSASLNKLNYPII